MRVGVYLDRANPKHAARCPRPRAAQHCLHPRHDFHRVERLDDIIVGTALGSSYVNDFPNKGRLQQVIVQADAKDRMQLEDVLRLRVRGAEGKTVALAELVTPEWSTSPLQLSTYNGYPSVSVTGTAAPGTSSGEAMREMERLASQLPPGFGIEWTGQSLQEREAGAQAPMLILLSMLVVFLVLAALYESWSIPVAVMLVVPLMLARGASAETQHAIGTGVFGGMITGTVLALLFVPVFFVVLVGLAERWQNRRAGREA
ncbi:efflux RND transporter permease subunit [Sphingomonas elodea]|uniref:efflux RND transporter permease subunit n=1 Tax=Sphingomonas elodea TaxID=179878 RepID=UPI00031B6B06|nr:efflux RND transporter permease subunit [Sphingomonas elodea]